LETQNQELKPGTSNQKPGTRHPAPGTTYQAPGTRNQEPIAAASFLASSSWAERTRQGLLSLKQSFDPKFDE